METPVQGRVLVLGAGGASRAVVSVLASLGWAVTLAARDRGQAFRLVAELKDLFNREPAVIELRDEDFISVTRQPVLIVNATPVGMDPETQASPISAEENLPEAGFVYDLITRPRETTLMRQARSRGLPAVNGLGMLLEQAALAFEQWTLHTASRDAMRAAIAQPVSPTRISKEAA
jgi:shikimate dehydrogenase